MTGKAHTSVCAFFLFIWKGRNPLATYTHEQLLELNESYHQDHTLTEDDVEMANYLATLVEATRNQYIPICGDIIEYTDKHGFYYPNGHIAAASSDEIYLCEQPYVPFLSEHPKKFGITTSTSGGAWAHIPSRVKYLGKRLKEFKQFGHCGGRANGAVTFQAEVNVWEYVSPGVEFSTKTHDRFELHIQSEPTDMGYVYLISKSYNSHTAFKTFEEYEAWLETYHGVERSGFSERSRTIWTYKQHNKCIPLQEYNQIIGAVIDSDLCNGYIQECKRVVKGTSVTTYLPHQHEKIELAAGAVRFSNARLSKMF